MKLNIKYYIVAFVVIIAAIACDDKLEVFETSGYVGVPAMVENISSEALPGQIKLVWNAPIGDFEYIKVSYYDFLQKKNKAFIASKGTTELLVDETRARFGDYTFKFQSFNSKHEGGEVKNVFAQSGPAPSTSTVKSETKLALESKQLSTHLPLANGTTVNSLLDGDVWSYINTAWQGDEAKVRPHWVQITLKESLQTFKLAYTTADGPYPIGLQIQVSTDGDIWDILASYGDELPKENRKEWKTGVLQGAQPFNYVRYAVTSSTSGSTGVTFKISELALYDVELEIYDPEKVPLD